MENFENKKDNTNDCEIINRWIENDNDGKVCEMITFRVSEPTSPLLKDLFKKIDDIYLSLDRLECDVARVREYAESTDYVVSETESTINNVYDALSYDFDLERLHSSSEESVDLTKDVLNKLDKLSQDTSSLFAKVDLLISALSNTNKKIENITSQLNIDHPKEIDETLNKVS